MTGLEMACAIALIIVSTLITIIVLVQKDRGADASAVMGGSSSSFFDKTQGHGRDAMLSKATIILGVILVVLVIATLAIILFL